MNTPAAVRAVLRRGPKRGAQIEALLPDRNIYTVRSALVKMRDCGAVTLTDGVHALAPGLTTERRYMAFMRRYRAQSRSAKAPARAAPISPPAYRPCGVTRHIGEVLLKAWG
jgi:hypothetical protein